MSETDQFWQYAKEATLSACYAKNDQDKQSLLDLARIWTQAALQAAPVSNFAQKCQRPKITMRV